MSDPTAFIQLIIGYPGTPQEALGLLRRLWPGLRGVIEHGGVAYRLVFARLEAPHSRYLTLRVGGEYYMPIALPVNTHCDGVVEELPGPAEAVGGTELATECPSPLEEVFVRGVGVVRYRPLGGDLVYACVADRCGSVHVGEARDVSTVLGVGEAEARLIGGAIARRLGYRTIRCLSVSVMDDGTEYCQRALVVRDLGGDVEVYLESESRGGLRRDFIARLPRDIRRVRDPLLGEYLAVFSGGRVIVASQGITELAEALRDMGYVIDRVDRQLQLAIDSLARSVEGYITPGITWGGIVDPRGELDMVDNGLEPLERAREWVVRYYGPNAHRALANIAFALAKVVTPAVRAVNRAFIDHVVWNHGRGGEGKTTLVLYAIAPMLGVRGDAEYVIIRGAVRTDAQFRNLLSLHRLPLILDEQNLRSLAANANFIIESAVGLGVIGVHASRYGPGIGARFMNLRGVVVFTNASFTEFLRRARDFASDLAFARRTLVINWDRAGLPDSAFGDLPAVASMLGAINRAWLGYRQEFVGARDLVDITRKLLVALGREYCGAGECRVIRDYMEAVDRVVRESTAEALVRSDEEVLVEGAYEFARRMGVVVRSWMDVVDAVLNNPGQSLVELAPARYSDEVVGIRDEVLGLLGVGPNTDYHTHPNVPSSVARALDSGLVYVRVHAHALDGAIPSTREFMGRERIYNPTRRVHYYVLTLTDFLRPFILQRQK